MAGPWEKYRTQEPSAAPSAGPWAKYGTAAPASAPTYDTPLTPEEETQFAAWKQQYAPNDSGADYDLRGAYKAGLTPDPQTGHWPDTFKKPNHETFSNESQYGKVPYAAAAKAGSWQGNTFVPAKTDMSVEARIRRANPIARPVTNYGEMAAQIPGSYAGSASMAGSLGDVEGVGRTVANWAGADVAPQPAMWSTEDTQNMLAGPADTPSKQTGRAIADTLAMFTSPFGAYNAIRKVVPAIGKTLAGERAVDRLKDLSRPVDKVVKGEDGALSYSDKTARKYFGEAVEENGYAPGVVGESILRNKAGLAEDAGIDTLNLTAGELTGDKNLLNAQAYLANKHGWFKAKTEENKAEALTALSEAAKGQAAVGDPAALRQAAQEGQNRLTSQLDDRMAQVTKEVQDVRDAASVGLSGAKAQSAQEAQIAAKAVEAAREQVGRGFAEARKSLDDNVSALARDAEAMRAAVKGGGPEAQARASAGIVDAAIKAERDASVPENELWSKISKTAPVDATAVESLFTAQKAENFSTKYKFNAEVENLLKDLKKTPNSGTLDKLRKATGSALAEARKTPGQDNVARVYSELYDGIADEMAKVPGSAEARAYTKAKKEAFDNDAIRGMMYGKFQEERAGQKAFTADSILSELNRNDLLRAADFAKGSAAGADMRAAQEAYFRAAAGLNLTDSAGKIKPAAVEDFFKKNPGVAKSHPEFADMLRQGLSSERALAAGQKEASALGSALTKVEPNALTGRLSPQRIAQVLRKTPLLAEKYPGLEKDLMLAAGAERKFDAAETAANEIGTAAQTLAPDALTGEFSPAKVSAFMRDRPDLVSKYPELANDLNKVVGGEQNLTATKEILKTRASKGQAFFGKLINVEDTPEAVGRALNSDTPLKDFRAMATIARGSKNPEEALDGLRAAAFQSKLREAPGKAEGTLSFEKLKNRMLEPLYNQGKQNFLDVMTSAGILDTSMRNRVQNIIGRGVQIEKAAGDPKAMDSLVGKADAFTQIALTLIGKLGGQGLLHSTRVGAFGRAQAGAELAKTTFLGVPLARTEEAFMELLLDPKLAADALTKPGKNLKTRKKIASRFARLGIQLGGADADE